MYSRHTPHGLGFAPVAAIAPALGPAAPVALAAGGAAYGISKAVGFFTSPGHATIAMNAWRSNPTYDGAVTLRDQLEGFLHESHGPFGAFQLAPVGAMVAELDGYISQYPPHQMEYQDDPEVISDPAPEDPGTIYVDVAEPGIPEDYTDPVLDDDGSIIPVLIPVAAGAAGASMIPILGGGGGGSQPAGSGGSSAFETIGSSYGFLYKFLPKSGGPDPDCDCSGKDPNYLGWAAAAVAVFWASGQKRKRRALHHA